MSFPFSVVSTFSGCGGSSLGYQLAGGKVLLAVEWNDNAVQTYRANFPDTPIYQGDIAKLSVEEACKLASIQPGKLDILDGSPPCQGFSTAGKRDFADDRNQLFREYIRLLRGLQPKVFVMENVSGMVKGKMKLIFAECLRELKASGYRVKARVLNAMYYGVPQSRQRLIFIGVRDDLGIDPSHPKAQTRPKTVREAFAGLTGHGDAPALTPLYQTYWRLTGPGGRVGKHQTIKRLQVNGIAGALLTAEGNGAPYHPTECRAISTQERLRLASFPDEFLMIGTHRDAAERIGNSVPPLFMKAIAEHIRDNLLSRTNGPQDEANA